MQKANELLYLLESSLFTFLQLSLDILYNTVKAGYKNTRYKNISCDKNTFAADQNKVFT